MTTKETLDPRSALSINLDETNRQHMQNLWAVRTDFDAFLNEYNKALAYNEHPTVTAEQIQEAYIALDDATKFTGLPAYEDDPANFNPEARLREAAGFIPVDGDEKLFAPDADLGVIYNGTRYGTDSFTLTMLIIAPAVEDSYHATYDNENVPWRVIYENGLPICEDGEITISWPSDTTLDL